MSKLRTALEKYLTMRKGLGYKYEHQTRRLADFVAFLDKRTASTITTKLAMEWATLPPDRHAYWALRLSDVRGFARHVACLDPKTEVPPVGMLPGLKRAKPYVYSDTEIGTLLTAALTLPPEDGLRRWTYHTSDRNERLVLPPCNSQPLTSLTLSWDLLDRGAHDGERTEDPPRPHADSVAQTRQG